MRIQESCKMRRDYHCSTREQSLRLLPLLVLVALMPRSFVSHAQSRNYGPEIITHGGCPRGAGQQLPYQIQTPLPPHLRKPRIAPYNPFEKKSYGYNIDGVEEPHRASCSGVELPVSIQQPILPPSAGTSSPPAYHHDPLRGKSYGIGIQPGPATPNKTPSLGQYDFGVQNSIPAANSRPAPALSSGPYRDPLGVQVQPAANPNKESPLWGQMPIGIQRPIESRSVPGNAGPAGPPAAPRLTGLTSNIDKLLVPVVCPIPMDGSEGSGVPSSGGGYPGGNGQSGGGGYPLGGGGYSGGNGPLGGGGGGYAGGNGPSGGAGYPGGTRYPASGFSSCG